MKPKKHRKRKRRLANPGSGFLTEKQLANLAADAYIGQMFGLFGICLTTSNPKLKEFLLKTSIVIEENSAALPDSSDPSSPALTQPKEDL